MPTKKKDPKVEILKDHETRLNRIEALIKRVAGRMGLYEPTAEDTNNEAG